MATRFIRSFLMGFCFLIVAEANAQVNITEYFEMGKGFKLDLENRSVEKAIYTKGILDITWDSISRKLTVTYDPRLMTVSKAVKRILDAASGKNDAVEPEKPPKIEQGTVSKDKD